MKPLSAANFQRDTVEVARDLLGQRLVRQEGSRMITGIILETEAYRGEEDLACHCRAGRTPRTEIMYGPPGRAYVYLIYGMYWLLNIVTEEEGSPGAVLIRALETQDGEKIVARRRAGQPREKWTDGPGKIGQALNIDGKLNGTNLTRPGPLFVARGFRVPPDSIQSGPRVGLDSVPEPWRSKAWRFMVKYEHLQGA